MSVVRIMGDLHFGHEAAHKFRSSLGFDNHKDYCEFLVDEWNSVVRKRDLVFVLGDLCFNQGHLHYVDRLEGRKILIGGNHDGVQVNEMARYVEDMHGVLVYKGLWLTHIPIHPDELHGRPNVHGHVHNGADYGPLYFNAVPEVIGYRPVPMDYVREVLRSKQQREDAKTCE